MSLFVSFILSLLLGTCIPYHELRKNHFLVAIARFLTKNDTTENNGGHKKNNHFGQLDECGNDHEYHEIHYSKF